MSEPSHVPQQNLAAFEHSSDLETGVNTGKSMAPPAFQLMASGPSDVGGAGEEGDCCVETGSAAPLQKMAAHQPLQMEKDPDPKPKPKKIQVAISKDMGRAEFLKTADLQIFGKHPGPGEWSGNTQKYFAKNSPYTVWVDVALLKKSRSEQLNDLGGKTDEEGELAGAKERAGEYDGMKKGKDGLTNEIDKRYEALGGEGVKDRSKIDKDLWEQVRDELLFEKEFVENLPEKVSLIIQKGPDGIKVTPSDYAQVVRMARKINKMELRDLENYLRNAKTAKSLDEVEKSLDGFMEEKDSGLKKIKGVMESEKDGDWDLDTETAKLTEKQMFYLTLEQRKKLIDKISDGYAVGDEDEATLIRLLVSAPSADQKALVAWLKSNKSKILKRLESVIDGEENKKYYATLRNLIFQSLTPEEAHAKMKGAKVLPWADPGLLKAVYNRRFYYETVEFTDDGRVKVEYWVNIAFMGMKTTTQYFEPDEVIGLYFFMDEDFANATEGQTIYMPAANLISFKNEQFSREMNLAVDIGLLAAGGVGLAAKGGRLAKAIAALDLTLGASAIVINSYRSDIGKTAEGQKFLQAWDTVNTLIAVYGLARIAVSMPKAFRNLKEAYQTFKKGKNGLDPTDMKKLDSETKKLLDGAKAVDLENDLARIRKTYSADELRAFEKQLEEAAGIKDNAKRAEAMGVLEDQIAAQSHNVKLADKLKAENPGMSNLDIAKKAAPDIKVPGVPIGFTKGSWVEAQQFIKKYLTDAGIKVEGGFATGSRMGAPFNPKKKAKFGKLREDFTPSDLDTTLITDKAIPKNTLEKLKAEFKSKFGIELGVRPIVGKDNPQLPHIPKFGTLDMKF